MARATTKRKTAKKKAVKSKKSIDRRTSEYKQLRTHQQREKIRAKLNITQAVNRLAKIESEILKTKGVDLHPNDLPRAKFLADIQWQKINKFIPNLKAVEVSGEDGGDVNINIVKFGDNFTE